MQARTLRCQSAALALAAVLWIAPGEDLNDRKPLGACEHALFNHSARASTRSSAMASADPNTRLNLAGSVGQDGQIIFTNPRAEFP